MTSDVDITTREPVQTERNHRGPGGRRSPSPHSAAPRRRSRVVVATVSGVVAFVAAGAASGLLLDEYGGLVGAVEWLLRTVVVIAAAVVIVGGTVLVFRLRRRFRRRPVGWGVATVAWLAFAWVVAIPLGFAVYLTHLPARAAVGDVDLGVAREDVTVTGADGVRLRGWYVPSRNGAAVIALHGTGSNRVGVRRHTQLLARHGYGVLALDLRGHGESDGRSTSAPWKLHDDLDGALDWLSARREVDPTRLGVLGVSLGGEVALQLAARRDDVRATVAEGVRGGFADSLTAGADPATVAQLAVLSVFSELLTGERSTSDAELVERVAPRPLLLISAGRTVEADANRAFARRGGPRTEHWNLPDARHAVAARTDPAGYERRVVGFLDAALAR